MSFFLVAIETTLDRLAAKPSVWEAIQLRCLGLVMAVGVLAGRATPEIRDVLTSTEIDRMFVLANESLVVHETPIYAVVFQVVEGKPSAYSMNPHADEIWFVRRGRARLARGGSLEDPKAAASGELLGSPMVGSREYEIGAGDVVNLPRNSAFRLDPATARVAYVAVCVFPKEAHPDPRLAEPAAMGDILNRSTRDAVFADNDSNQPLHSVRNVNVNYVIYKGRSRALGSAPRLCRYRLCAYGQ